MPSAYRLLTIAADIELESSLLSPDRDSEHFIILNPLVPECTYSYVPTRKILHMPEGLKTFLHSLEKDTTHYSIL